jgi:hypothetical protein
MIPSGQSRLSSCKLYRPQNTHGCVADDDIIEVTATRFQKFGNVQLSLAAAMFNTSMFNQDSACHRVPEETPLLPIAHGDVITALSNSWPRYLATSYNINNIYRQ